MPRPLARAAAFQVAVFGMTGLLETRLKIADRLDATVSLLSDARVASLRAAEPPSANLAFFQLPCRPALHPSHHREVAATRVFTVPSVNYRQHPRHQADGPLAVLALRALGICDIDRSTRPVA